MKIPGLFLSLLALSNTTQGASATGTYVCTLGTGTKPTVSITLDEEAPHLTVETRDQIFSGVPSLVITKSSGTKKYSLSALSFSKAEGQAVIVTKDGSRVILQAWPTTPCIKE